MVQDKLITVEVAFALPHKQAIIAVKVSDGATAYDAVLQSGICQKFEQIDADNDKMGLFGKAIRDPKKEVLKAGDRVEIYRPLLIDPKASRLQRAEKAKQEKQSSDE
ncbi:MAG: RnfH family protein [Pseudomonadales bacterium]